MTTPTQRALTDVIYEQVGKVGTQTIGGMSEEIVTSLRSRGFAVVPLINNSEPVEKVARMMADSYGWDADAMTTFPNDEGIIVEMSSWKTFQTEEWERAFDWLGIDAEQAKEMHEKHTLIAAAEKE